MKGLGQIMARVMMIALVVCLGMTVSYGQLPAIRQVFLDAPNEVLPSLGDVERANVLSAYDALSSGKAALEPSRNILGGDVSVLQLSDTFLRLSLDSFTDLQMKVLPYKNSKKYILAVVVTSMVVPAQSVVVFYDPDWKRLDQSKFIDLPLPEDFLVNAKDIERREVKNALVERGRLSYRIDMESENESLRIKVSTFEDEVASKLHSEVIPLLKQEGVSYEWNKRRGFIRK